AIASPVPNCFFTNNSRACNKRADLVKPATVVKTRHFPRLLSKCLKDKDTFVGKRRQACAARKRRGKPRGRERRKCGTLSKAGRPRAQASDCLRNCAGSRPWRLSRL